MSSYTKVYVDGWKTLSADDQLVPYDGQLDITRNTDLEDQADEPHGWHVVHRRDERGWYVRYGECEEPNYFASCPCGGRDEDPCMGYEMVSGYIDSDHISQLTCGSCWEATCAER